MKIASVIVRLLLGAMYLFASISYFVMDPADMPKMTGTMLKVNEGFVATGYLFPLVKTLELICGIALVSGFFVPLAAVVILPVTVNIFFFHAFLTPNPADLVVPVLMLAANIFVLYHKRNQYKGMFVK